MPNREVQHIRMKILSNSGYPNFSEYLRASLYIQCPHQNQLHYKCYEVLQVRLDTSVEEFRSIENAKYRPHFHHVKCHANTQENTVTTPSLRAGLPPGLSAFLQINLLSHHH